MTLMPIIPRRSSSDDELEDSGLVLPQWAKELDQSNDNVDDDDEDF